MEPLQPQSPPAPAPIGYAPVAPTQQPEVREPAPSSEYPVQVDVSYPEKQSRIIALFGIPFFFIRFLLLIPQLIVLYVISIASFLAAWLNFWVVLFTGRSSKGLHSFIAGSVRWNTRVSSYLYGLTDQYPPFRLKP